MTYEDWLRSRGDPKAWGYTCKDCVHGVQCTEGSKEVKGKWFCVLDVEFGEEMMEIDPDVLLNDGECFNELTLGTSRS